MVKVLSGSDKTLQGVDFFCTGEKPTETNVSVKFRVIPSVKPLHWKEFYIANFPGWTKTLAPLAFI